MVSGLLLALGSGPLQTIKSLPDLDQSKNAQFDVLTLASQEGRFSSSAVDCLLLWVVVYCRSSSAVDRSSLEI